MIRKLLPVLLLVGCASQNYTPPAAVQAMPNDCANRVAIISWLESQAAIPRQPFESEQVYEQSRAQFRHRLWHVRYVCQPV
jgi:hypothetical protein